jgi:hypothetical protein
MSFDRINMHAAFQPVAVQSQQASLPEREKQLSEKIKSKVKDIIQEPLSCMPKEVFTLITEYIYENPIEEARDMSNPDFYKEQAKWIILERDLRNRIVKCQFRTKPSWHFFEVTMLKNKNNQRYQTVYNAFKDLIRVRAQLHAVDFHEKCAWQHNVRYSTPSDISEGLNLIRTLRINFLEVVFTGVALGDSIDTIVTNLHQGTLLQDITNCVKKMDQVCNTRKLTPEYMAPYHWGDHIRKLYEECGFQYQPHLLNSSRMVCKICDAEIQSDCLHGAETLPFFHERSVHIAKQDRTFLRAELAPQYQSKLNKKLIEGGIPDIDQRMQELRTQLILLEAQKNKIIRDAAHKTNQELEEEITALMRGLQVSSAKADGSAQLKGLDSQ